MQQLNGENDAFIEAVLRRAEFGRTNNFDIVQKEGYVFLREEITADFPYLTLTDLRNIITLGVKGEIDATKTPRPLNCTRIYQWVKHRAPFSLGYWQAKHPALLDWAEMAGITEPLLAEIDAYETPAAAFAQPHKMRALLQKVLRATLAPQIDFNGYNYHSTLDQFPAQAAALARIERKVYPAFLRKYPEMATQHTPLF